MDFLLKCGHKNVLNLSFNSGIKARVISELACTGKVIVPNLTKIDIYSKCPIEWSSSFCLNIYSVVKETILEPLYLSSPAPQGLVKHEKKTKRVELVLNLWSLSIKIIFQRGLPEAIQGKSFLEYKIENRVDKNPGETETQILKPEGK